jgi:dTDP-4-amino-4,6-dideoxygalactose transaminase
MVAAERYVAGITHADVTLPPLRGEAYVAHLFVVRSAKRDSLRAHLLAQGVHSDVHYLIPDHRQPVAGDTYVSVSLPTNEALATTILTLPCYPEMTDEAVDRIIAAVNGWPA